MRTIKNVTEEKGKKMLKSLIAFLNANNGEGDVTPLQESCLENPMDEGAWWAAVYGVAQSRTRLSDFTFTFHFHALEEETLRHPRPPSLNFLSLLVTPALLTHP